MNQQLPELRWYDMALRIGVAVHKREPRELRHTRNPGEYKVAIEMSLFQLTIREEYIFTTLEGQHQALNDMAQRLITTYFKASNGLQSTEPE